MQLGRAINAIRVAKGISQDTIVKESGLSPGYYSLLENGHRMPSFEALGAICNSLQVPMWQVIFLLDVSLEKEENIPSLDFPELHLFIDSANQSIRRLHGPTAVLPQQLTLFDLDKV